MLGAVAAHFFPKLAQKIGGFMLENEKTKRLYILAAQGMAFAIRSFSFLFRMEGGKGRRLFTNKKSQF